MITQETVEFTGKDFAELAIVVADDAALPEKFAATELQRHIRLATGREIPVVDCLTDGKRNIVVGDMAKQLLPEVDAIISTVRHDGFAHHCDGGNLIIVGNCPRGTLNGVYTLLHDWGFRWVYPKKGNDVIPPLTSHSFSFGTRIVNPDLELRGVCIFPVNEENLANLREIIDWMGKNRINTFMSSINRANNRKLGWIVDWMKVSDQLLPELQKRGIILNISEHSNRYFFPTSYFEEHPEWFAMNAEGKRFATGQMCYSNAEGVSVLVENYARYVEDHPEVDIIGTWPEDGYGFCQCEQCKKPGAVLNAVNKIAERIEQIRPDLTVEYLSYTKETSEVPADILPRHNMAVLVANTRVAEEWRKKTEKVGGRGVYQLNYHIADNTAHRASLPLRFEKTRQDCLNAKQIGLRGIIPFFIGIDTWWRSALNLYFMTQFSWDVKKSVDEILKDFCGAYFPHASEDTFALFKELEKMPMANQHTPPPWPLWQEWSSIKDDYTGKNWEAILETYSRIHAMLDECARKSGGHNKKGFDAIRRFVESAKTMLQSWHERALAVAAFESNDAVNVRKHITEAAKHERHMNELIEKSQKIDDGVNGAWVDFSFFQNWRLQLDKQLLEMRTSAQKKPVVDENSDVEMFLPGLLGL